MTDAHADRTLADRVRRMFDQTLNRRRPHAMAELIADDVVDHSPGPGQVAGLAGLEQMVGSMLDLNPELRVTVDDVIVEGERVAVRETWHTINGVQQIAHFFTFSGGRIVEEWSMGWGDPPANPAPDTPRGAS